MSLSIQKKLPKIPIEIKPIKDEIYNVEPIIKPIIEPINEPKSEPINKNDEIILGNTVYQRNPRIIIVKTDNNVKNIVNDDELKKDINDVDIHVLFNKIIEISSTWGIPDIHESSLLVKTKDEYLTLDKYRKYILTHHQTLTKNIIDCMDISINELFENRNKGKISTDSIKPIEKEKKKHYFFSKKKKV